MIEPGATLGAYRIERLLGRGGMGAVFLAYDTILHRQVALKLVSATDQAETARAPSATAAPRLKAAVGKALELDPNLAEAHHQLALQYAWTDWDWPAAETAFRRAIALDGSLPESHAFHGHYL